MERELELLKIAVSILVDNENIIQHRNNSEKDRKLRQKKSWAAF